MKSLHTYHRVISVLALGASVLMLACTPVGVAPIQTVQPPATETPATSTPTPTPTPATPVAPPPIPTNTGTGSAVPVEPGDRTPPYVSGMLPTPDATGVLRGDTRILVHVRDDGAGVDAASVILTVAGERVTPQISGAAADLAVAYVPQAAFGLGQRVEITLEARDLASIANNMEQATWSFILAASPTPGAYTATADLGLTGAPPNEVDITAYRLEISGMVDNPLELTYAEILAYPSVSGTPPLECEGFFLDKAEWTGVPMTTLLDTASLKQGAGQAIFHATDGYRLSLPLDTVRRTGTYMAYMVNGQALPLKHGYPLRLVVSDTFGFNWAKWVTKIELVQ